MQPPLSQPSSRPVSASNVLGQSDPRYVGEVSGDGVNQRASAEKGVSDRLLCCVAMSVQALLRASLHRLPFAAMSMIVVKYVGRFSTRENAIEATRGCVKHVRLGLIHKSGGGTRGVCGRVDVIGGCSPRRPWTGSSWRSTYGSRRRGFEW